MIPPDLRHVHAYIEAREALDRFAAIYGASDATMSHRSAGYVLLAFDDREAEDRFFSGPGVDVKISVGEADTWRVAEYRLGKVVILAMRKIETETEAA